MERLHPIGVRRDAVPIPPVKENTTYVQAGAVALGVEYRQLNDDIVNAHAASDPNVARVVAAAEKVLKKDGEAYNGQGVSIHVFDAHTDDEYLRFDDFDDDPHYHYITPGSHQVGVGFDRDANGDYLEWVYRSLGERMVEMLQCAGASELAAQIDQATIRRALSEVKDVVRHAINGDESPTPTASA
jgi:hypothetical protein